MIEATVVHWVPRDGVGRLRLASGEEVRFGASACPFPPSVGLQVHVLELAPHPLGGQRALRLQALPGQSIDALYEAAGPVPGAREVNEFAQITDEVGLLGVVVKTAPGDRASLRAWLERFGASVDFSHPATPLLTIERTPWRVWRCTADVAGGKGVISFAPHAPSAPRPRAPRPSQRRSSSWLRASMRSRSCIHSFAGSRRRAKPKSA